jgi:putative hydrolase of the HAD superfamily
MVSATAAPTTRRDWFGRSREIRPRLASRGNELPTTRIETIFFDVGGVCLTNGWDTDARRAAASHFSLDVEDLEARHQLLASAFERGERSLEAYLDQVVFHQERAFSRDAFSAFMRQQSQPHPSSLRLIRSLALEGSYRLATINNESRELNRHRIDTFRLREIFSTFFSSCYLGVRKPDARIYEIALDVMQAERAASLFVDDREENVAAALAVGMRALHVSEPGRLVERIREAGV